jgi:hypothetical protein
MGLSVPVRVVGHDPDGRPWEEMTATEDASYGGASFSLKHPHAVGQVLHLSSPLPRNFRRYDLAETSYKTYALVRNMRAGDRGEHVVGVLFLGRVAPKGFETRPGGRFRLPDDPKTGATTAARERRRHERLPIFVNVRVQRPGASGAPGEQTVTENVSRGGARVFTTLPIAAGETVTVTDLAHTAPVEARVCHVYAPADGVTRLNLEFLDPAAFERLLRAAGVPSLPAGKP